MRSAQSVVQILIEATKSRSIAFGPTLPGEGYRALDKADMLGRLRGYGIPEEDALQRFIILYTDNNGDLRFLGDTNAKLSQSHWENTVQWLRLDPHGTQTAIEDTGNGAAGETLNVATLFNFQDRDERAGSKRSLDQFDLPFFGFTYAESEKPPRLVKVTGPAKRSGLRPNDQILRMGGKDVSEPGALKKAIASAKDNAPVTFTVRRAQMECPQCSAEQSVIPNRVTECPSCGHSFKADSDLDQEQYQATVTPT